MHEPVASNPLAGRAYRQGFRQSFGLTLPAGDGYVWIACETLVAKRLRAIMVDERQHPKAWIKAAGYWKRGQADFHETHGD